MRRRDAGKRTALPAATAPRTPRKLSPRGMLLLFSLAMAVGLYSAFLPTERTRWAWAMHDRGVHALAAIKLAAAAQSGDFATFFSELLKPKLYPPLQALLGAAAALIAGPHYHVVALPSLLGWMMMVVMAAALAYRVAWQTLGPGTIRWIAGIAAVLWVVGSPAHRFYATDTMLESLGAGLTLAAVYAYGAARETPDGPRTRWLALALTALFFEKYNYWLLTVLALAAEFLLTPAVRGAMLGAVRARGRATLLHLLRQPLLWIAALLVATAAGISLHGPLTIGKVSLYPPRGVLTVAVWFVALQIAVEFLRLGRARYLALPAWARMLWAWHGVPLLVWLLLPGRLATIAFFVGTSNAGEARYSGWSGVVYYARCLADQYALGWPELAAAAALAVVGIAATWRQSATARAVAAVLFVGTALALLHPNKQGRYLHSFIPALWVLAALGIAAISAWVERRRATAGTVAGGVLCAGLAVWVGAAIKAEPSGHDELQRLAPPGTLLEATDTYLNALPAHPRAAIFVPSAWPVAEWTFLEKFPDTRLLNVPRWEADITPAAAAEKTRVFLQTAPVDEIVLVQGEPGSAWTQEGYANPAVQAAIAAVLKSPLSGFRTEEVWRFSLSGAEVTLLVRGGPVIVVPGATRPAESETREAPATQR